jgi:asparagine synthetase B (glutamine-hydrolysing)
VRVLHDLYAAWFSDGTRADALEATMRGEGRWDWIGRPGPGWVAARRRAGSPTARPISPSGGPSGYGSRSDADGGPRVVVAEGEEVLSEEARRRGGAWWERLGEMACSRPERLGEVPGDFSFLAFCPDGSASVVRSCAGRAPFHLLCDAGTVAVATRALDLVRYAKSPPVPDGLVWALGACAIPWRPEGRGVYVGVAELPRAHATVLIPGKSPWKVRYHDPRADRWPRPGPSEAGEHVQCLRRLLLEGLRQELDPEGVNLLSLSGGVDSSTLGAIASGVLGMKVASLSFVPEAGSPGAEKELYYIRNLGRKVGIADQVILALSPAEWPRRAAATPGIGYPAPHMTFGALEELRESLDVSVVFGGEHADEVCGAPVTVGDWAMATGVSDLAASLRRLPQGPGDLLRWLAWRVAWALGRPRTHLPRSLPPVFAAGIREEYAELRRELLKSSDAGRPWPLLALRARLDAWIGVGWELASESRVAWSLPFLRRETIDLVNRCHPSELVGPGSKLLLKKAVGDLVPAENLHRPDKGSPLVAHMPSGAGLPAELPSSVQGLVEGSELERRDQVSFPSALALAALAAGARSFEGSLKLRAERDEYQRSGQVSFGTARVDGPVGSPVATE